jgi:hypothetical protein
MGIGPAIVAVYTNTSTTYLSWVGPIGEEDMISNSYKEAYSNYNLGVVKGVFMDNMRKNHGNPDNGLMRAWVEPVSAGEERGQGVVDGLIWKREKSGLMGRHLWVHTVYQVEERLYQSWMEEEEERRQQWEEEAEEEMGECEEEMEMDSKVYRTKY